MNCSPPLPPDLVSLLDAHLFKSGDSTPNDLGRTLKLIQILSDDQVCRDTDLIDVTSCIAKRCAFLRLIERLGIITTLTLHSRNRLDIELQKNNFMQIPELNHEILDIIASSLNSQMALCRSGKAPNLYALKVRRSLLRKIITKNKLETKWKR